MEGLGQIKDQIYQYAFKCEASRRIELTHISEGQKFCTLLPGTCNYETGNYSMEAQYGRTLQFPRHILEGSKHTATSATYHQGHDANPHDLLPWMSGGWF